MSWHSQAAALLLIAAGAAALWAMRQDDGAASPPAAPSASAGDGTSCQPPAEFAMPRVRQPDRDDVRRTPVTRYTLALSWSPAFCARQARWAEPDSMQCSGQAGRFGFILHGLWPETVGRDWPQYCRPARAVPRETLRRHLCRTPSPELLQHEWERHGTCMSGTPETYFDSAARLYDRIVMPDMAALQRSASDAGDLRRAFVAANRGLTARMISVRTDDGGRLEEVRLCLDQRFAYAACPPGERGVPDRVRLTIAPVIPR